MYKNKESGISLITLTVAIILLIIITSMLIYNAQTGTKLKSLNEMYNDIAILTDKINVYYSNYGAIPANIEYTNTNAIQQIKDSGQLSPNDNDVYYVIDLSAIGNLTLTYGLEYKNITKENANQKEDIYIINEQSHHVYYVLGITFDNATYYTNELEDNVELYY